MLRKNVAGQFVYFAGINATTGAALTGATFSGRRSIDGTFAAIGATITEDTGTGFYKVALTQADTDGNDLAFFFTATNAVPVCMTVLATAANPADAAAYGLTNLDSTVSSRLATAGYTAPDNASVAAILVDTAAIDARLPSDPADQSVVIAATDAILAAVDTRLPTASYTAPDNASVTAIKAKTDSLTFTKALELDANLKSVNSVTVNGDGAGTPMGV